MAELGKKLALGFGVTTVFFLLVELLLMAVGVEPLYERTDPYVGFSGYSPLFQKRTHLTGESIFETARNKASWFNKQSFPVHKAEGVTRIFCVGGSTTYGRPYNDQTSFCGWLREFLPAVDPTRRWEVINAGGISYASYRVARLMEELAEYKPDLFIVYSGHNEFLEKRTYDKLRKTPELVRNLGALASRLRLYSTLYNLNYERNAILTTEVKARLDGSVGPDDYHRDDEMRDAVLEHYQTSLVRMAHIAERAGARLIFVTPASNIGDFSPFKTEPSAGMGAHVIQQVSTLKVAAKKTLDEGNHAQALAISKQALAIDARDPELLYLKAKALRGLGRIDEARKAYINARDEDICPLRALTPVSAIIADVARQRNAGFVDFERFVAQHSPDRIPGSELFLDHVHPTIEGNRLLALEIIKEMTQKGIVFPAITWNAAAITEISEKLESSLDEQTHAEALRNLSKVLGWAGRHDEALRLMNLSMAKTSETGRNHYLKATLLERAGNTKDALVHYREAINLSPMDAAMHHDFGVLLSKLGHKAEARLELEIAIRLKPTLVGAHYDLGVVLEVLGEARQAEAAYRTTLKLDPNQADAHNNLGVLLAMRGNISAAFEHFREAVRINPNHSNAADNLARARADLRR